MMATSWERRPESKTVHEANEAGLGRRPRRRKAEAAEEPGLIRLSKVPQRDIRWLWRDYIPAGKITMIDGDPGVGKSSLALDFAARVSRGSPWPDGSSGRAPGAVLILNAEEDVADTIVPRIKLAGGDPDKIWVLAHVPDEQGGGQRLPSIPRDVDHFTRLIEKHGVVLVIVDVLNAFLGSDTNTHRDADIRRALYPLHKMAVETGAAVVLLRHLNKTTAERNPMYRGGGSIGITGQARAAYIVGISPDNPELRLFAPVKMNVGALPHTLGYQLIPDESGQWATVAWKGEAPHTAAQLLAEPTSAEGRRVRDEAAWWLKAYLEAPDRKRQAPKKDIVEAARKHGITERTLARAREDIGVETKREGWQEGTTWILPPEEPA